MFKNQIIKYLLFNKITFNIKRKKYKYLRKIYIQIKK